MGWFTSRKTEAREQAIAKREAQVARAATVLESFGCYDLDNFISPYERFWDGDDFYGPTAGAWGTINDRKHGANRPYVFTEYDVRLYRTLSRQLCTTNYFAIGLLERLVEFGVAKGYTWSVSLKGAEPGANHAGGASVDPRVMRCQSVLDEWKQLNSWGAFGCADPCDPTDDPGIIQNREKEGFRRWRRDGTVNVRWFEGNRRSNGLPLIRWIEPEQIWTEPGQSDATEYAQGIRTSPTDSETIISYWVRDPNGNGTDGEQIPAWQVTRLNANVDATIKHGIPDFAPMHEDLETCRKLLRNMSVVSAGNAALAYITEHAPGVTSTQVNSMIESGKDLSRRKYSPAHGGSTSQPTNFESPGTVHHVKNGQKYVDPPANAGAPNHILVQQALLRGACSRLGFPEFFSGDASNNNYASLLATGGMPAKANESRQADYGFFQRALATKVLAFAVKSGRLTRDDVMAVEVKCTAPESAVIDTLKQTQEREIKCRNKVLSPQTWASQDGLDWAQEEANLQAFDEAFPDMGGGDGGMGDLFGGKSGDKPKEPKTPESVQKKVNENFTGTVQGADGHTYHYADGKRVGGADDGKKKGETVTFNGETDAESPAVKSKIRQVAENAALKILGIMYKADSAFGKYGLPAIEAIIDTPDDLKTKFGYNPAMMGVDSHILDPLKQHTGCSSHFCATVICQAVPLAFTAVKRALGKRKPVAKEATESPAEIMDAAVALRSMFGEVFRAMGLDDDGVEKSLPSLATIESYIRDKIKGE